MDPNSNFKLLPSDTEKNLLAAEISKLIIGANRNSSSASDEVNKMKSVMTSLTTLMMQMHSRVEVSSASNGKLLKSEAVSKSLRQAGNSAYQKKDYPQALSLYTQSIAAAPVDSDELSLAFANRSAVLKAFGNLEECIADVQRAISHGYPQLLCFKLFSREAQCYRDLGCHDKAAKSFHTAKEYVENSDFSAGKKAELLNFIEAELKVKKSDVIKKPTKSLLDISLSYGSCKEAPSASGAVHIKHNETFGRHLVATRDIKPGNVLMIDKPFATFLEPKCRWSHCNHCLQPSRSLLPCATCNWALYCSDRCLQEAAAKYHNVECPIMAKYFSAEDEADVSKDVFLIRVIATFGLENLESFLENEGMQECGDPCTKGFNSQGIYDSTDFTTMYNLMSNISKYPKTALLVTGLKVIRMLQCFINLDAPNGNKLLEAFLKLYFSLSNNCLSIDDLVYVRSSAVRLEEIACGIFPTASLACHSCVPNLIRIIHGTSVVYRAARPIKEGSQLTICYGPRFFEASKYERQARIEKYFFECKCEACTNNWPLMENLPAEPTFSCKEKQLESKIKTAKIKFETAVALKSLMNPNENVLHATFNHNKEQFEKLLTLMHANNKTLNRLYLRLEYDQETYYQSLGNCIAWKY